MVEKTMLEQFNVLADMPDELLEKIAPAAELISCNPGDVIFREGMDATHLHGVIEGEVALSVTIKHQIMRRDVSDGAAIEACIETVEEPIAVASVLPGQIFAWSSFIEPFEFTTTAVSAGAAKIIKIPAQSIRTLFDHNPVAGYRFMEHLAGIVGRRLRKRTRSLIENWNHAFEVPRD